jgi:hypothetical protein
MRMEAWRMVLSLARRHAELRIARRSFYDTAARGMNMVNQAVNKRKHRRGPRDVAGSPPACRLPGKSGG